MKARTIGLSAASLAIGAVTGFGIYGLSGAAFAETNGTTTPTTPSASAPAQPGGNQGGQNQSGKNQSGQNQSGQNQSGKSGSTDQSDQKDQNGGCGPRDGKGGGGHEHTTVTGTEATKVTDAVKAKDSAFTATSVEKDPDGSYDVRGTKNGQQTMYEVSADLKTITERTHR